MNCSAGYIGSHCENRCSFPSFGYGCQQVCLCSRKQCHFTTGCQFKQMGKFVCGVEFYKAIYDLFLLLFMFIVYTFLHLSHIYPHISWISIIGYTFHIPYFLFLRYVTLKSLPVSYVPQNSHLIWSYLDKISKYRLVNLSRAP